jgi:DMSO/TMAO reductase YedYZ molybdopterin-dependent catalytic subunit
MKPTTAPGRNPVPRPHVVTTDPLNAETPLSVLDGGLTPTEAFYIRSNFPAPALDAEVWTLRVRGAVEHPRSWTLQELQALDPVRCRMTLECAGNGRKQVEPRPPGTPWGLGAAGTAEFTGVPLRKVLERAGLRPEATTCVFSGADEGTVEDGSHTRFQRSLSVAEAMGRDGAMGGDGATDPAKQRVAGEAGPGYEPREAPGDVPLLAWAMNGEPLTRDHGYPIRLVVPRWYAVASVKWLVDIEVTDRPFEGWFQTDRYMYRGRGEATPVRTMRVRSLITSHADGSLVAAGGLRLGGVAWSGEAPIARAEVQVDDGPWTAAALAEDPVTGVATEWVADLDLEPGGHAVRVRAVDGAGHTQPDRSPWNALGYGNNGVHEVRLLVE